MEQKIAPDLRGLLTFPVKRERETRVSVYVDEMLASFTDLDEAHKTQAKRIFNQIKERTIREWILGGTRPDGEAYVDCVRTR